eukprot:3607070-Pyramimonas_sp.AAC.1
MMNGGYLRLFDAETEVNAAFALLDVKQFRNEWFMRRRVDIVPGAGATQQVQEPGEHADGGYECELHDADGLPCSKRFKSKRALLVHQRQAEGGQHGGQRTTEKITMTNQCVACRSSFEDR